MTEHEHTAEELAGLLRALGEAGRLDAVRHYYKPLQDAEVVEEIARKTREWGAQ
jgi:hypothetical protein